MKLFNVGLLVTACLLTSGCMTDKVIKMNTREISHFIAKEAYLQTKESIYVRFGPPEPRLRDTLSLWVLNDKVEYTYGTQGGVNFFYS